MAGESRTAAGDHYTLEFAARQRSRPGMVGAALWAAASTMTLGFLGSPRMGDFVIRRRADGAEVLRVDADSEEATGRLRAQLERELATLSRGEFDQEWSISA